MADVQLLFGPILIGVFLNTILYGILITQVSFYTQSRKAKSDSKWLRFFVFYLFFSETLNTCFDIYLVYEPLVQRFGTIAAVTTSPLMLNADAVMTVMISVPVQLFICQRIRMLTGSNIVAIIIALFALGSFAGGLATTIGVSLSPEFAKFPELTSRVITWLGCSAVADILITTALVISLYKRRTGFAATDDVINRIIRLAIQTGLITSIFAMLDVVFFLAFPHTSLNFTWDFALSKLYSNSLLSTLNARTSLSATLTNRKASDNVLFGPGTQLSEHSTAIELKESEFEYTSKAGRNFQLTSHPAYPPTPGSAIASGNQARTPRQLEAGRSGTSPWKATGTSENEQKPYTHHKWTGEYNTRYGDGIPRRQF